MDNMLHLRQEYGSGVLEELNEKVYPYRRNVAGAITLALFAVHEALTTKLPLPQFLPSARLAHLRMVNRVREVVLEKDDDAQKYHDRSEIEMTMVRRVVRQKFLSWNAASAGQIEVIEYLEELIDLVKLLVGANEFRSGMLTRPTYREYVQRIGRRVGEREAEDVARENEIIEQEREELRDVISEPQMANVRRRTTFSGRESVGEKDIEEEARKAEDELPRSLQRVRSRRIEELNLQKSRSIDEEMKKKREGKPKGKLVDKSG
jgi:hypothetical protein